MSLFLKIMDADLQLINAATLVCFILPNKCKTLVPHRRVDGSI